MRNNNSEDDDDNDVNNVAMREKFSMENEIENLCFKHESS